MAAEKMRDMDSGLHVAYFGVKKFPSTGGTSRVVQDLVENLENGFQVTVYCEPGSQVSDRYPHIRLVQIAHPGSGSIGTAVHYLLCAMHVLVFGRYDLVHVHKIDAVLFAALFSWRIPCVLTSHEAPYRSSKWSSGARAFFRFSEKVYLRTGAALTCVSRTLTAEYRTRTNRNVSYIGNALRKDIDVDLPGARDLLKHYGIEGPFALFAARRIQRTKGCHTLVDAYALSEIELPLLIVGDASHETGFVEALHERAQGLAVKFIEPVDRATLMALLELSAVFVFPSETEAMSIMLLEAARSGTPIIASDIEANTVLFNESEGCFFRTGDASHLAEQLKAVVRSPEQYAARAQQARQRVADEYGINAVTDEYANLYRNCVVMRSRRNWAGQ